MLKGEKINTKKDKRFYLCEECFGGKDIFNGEDYVKCLTCSGKGRTTKTNNYKFLSTITNQD